MGHPKALRIAFLGNDERSVPSLGALAGSRHDVRLVVTRPPRPARRGGGDRPTPVATVARRLDLRLLEVDTVKSGPGLEALVSSEPDVLAVVAYGEILPASVLSIPAVAPVNLHFSLLPKLRGASPVQTALLLGLETTGVTTIVMDAGVDTGPVLKRAEIAIEPRDDAGSLGARLAELGGRVLVSSLDALAAGSLTPVPQDDASATYALKIHTDDRAIDWTAAATKLSNLVRALSPEPAATTTFRERPLKVFRATAVAGSGEPGTVVGAGGDGPSIATGEGALRLLEVAPAGRKRMSGAAFVNGFRPAVGERLG